MSPQPTLEEYDAPRLTPAVQVIAVLCLGVAFLQATVISPEDMSAWLGFQTAHAQREWWTVVTYAFVHGGLWHLALNVFTVLVFGPRVEQAWGSKTFTVFFLWCAAGGALAHLLVTKTGVLIGASAGIFGVMLAYAWLWPKDEVYLFGVLPMRVWTLVTLLAAVNLALGLNDSGTSGVAYFAHLGGFAFALLYLKRPTHVSIDQLRQRIAAAPDPTDETPRAIPRTLPRSRRAEDVDEIVAQSKAAVAKRPMRAATSTQRRDAKVEELNHVLDKISEHGLDSLTSAERLLLEEMSRRLRGR
jgi:membrane associated rhomboid family serine protease